MKEILIIEDDKKISRIIELQLNHSGFKTVKAFSGREGIEAYNLNPAFALILLDIMLPEVSGYEVLKYIKTQNNHIPVILLTAKDDTSDVVTGFDLGADDYVTKPFNFDELLARIKANIRKSTPESAAKKHLVFKDIKIDLDSFSVKRQSVEIALSRTEFDLFYYLVLNHDLVQSREQILANVWGFDYDGGENIVDVYIKYLRDKIDRDFAEKYIQTIRGRGYVVR
ncbi:response regulator transcription factor [Acetobacterium woodii]|uniref:Stage 0 sporulation protein A homolog n=1 Tax=Acetobacterium woodii (strain ATCC 29683 / DSM 1030 / JCM 2381 / KCTC 1655 / WB1) TaxID=931626 RepID=H6LF44_ACEWD|nr:response regulator transcription factor [Acetobacterium woodii]AFA48144.1 transcriptional regulator [Acetobacterium woodii DSM 1030]